MDTLATIYDKIHVIECSGVTLLLGVQPPDPLLQRYSQLPPFPAGPTSVRSYSTQLDGTWYNLLLLEMSLVGLQNQLCSHGIATNVHKNPLDVMEGVMYMC